MIAPKRKALEPDDAVSRTSQQWCQQAQSLRISNNSIHQRARLHPGSKTSHEQYILLKVLWDQEYDTVNAQNQLGLGQFHEQAANWLSTFEPFQRYLRCLDNPITPTPDIGIFEIAYPQQRETRKVISSHNSLGQVNEEVVNASLVSLPMAITMKHPNVHTTWTPQRASLTARFRKSAMVCMLDGFLYYNLTSQTQVILEAKARRCEDHIRARVQAQSDRG
ncbi:hypothetical protein N7535_004240 [Penicillium sp. DV-2018c]|nr:hypothetical protein N7461_000054 [Penicillium sp. DV-2018c]KAJ5577314.1 hypothetical protein N7535_004240 [Penicillium sp. DV-2018c]